MTLSDLVDEALKFYEANQDPIVTDVKPIQESIHEDSREEVLKPENEGEKTPEEEKKEDEAAAQDAPPEAAEEVKKDLAENPMFRRSGPIDLGDDDAVSEQSEIDEEVNQDEDFRVCG